MLYRTSKEPVSPRVIILADGRTKDSHLADNRLLTPINGMPLLLRTVRQFHKWAHVAVLTSNNRIWQTATRARNVFRVESEDKSHQYHGIDMIRKGLDHAIARRSIIVFGDVVFTDEAVETIKNNEVDGWAVYGRSVASEIGSPWAEYFAIEVNWDSREAGKLAVNDVASQYIGGLWPYCTAWEWYYNMERMPYSGRANPKAIEVGPHWVEINDETDDIDFEVDIIKMQEAHREMA